MDRIRELLIDIKLIGKKVVTNSDFLSSIRRIYRSYASDYDFKKMQKKYLSSSFPEKIKECKDIHAGKRCFIIGNGPSLNNEDLERIKDEFSFATNRVFLIFDKTSWRPTYWMCQDRQILRSVTDLYQSYKGNMFLGYHALYDYGINLSNANYYLCNAKQYKARKKELDFSDEVDKFVIDGGSVTYSCIQMAVYMGFKKIYLLGVDHNFSRTLDKNLRIVEHNEVKNDYFDEKYKDIFKKFEEKGKVYAAPDSEMITHAFEAAKKYCDAHDVEIFNATRGGKLEVFTRVKFDDIMEGYK